MYNWQKSVRTLPPWLKIIKFLQIYISRFTLYLAQNLDVQLQVKVVDYRVDNKC